MNTSVAQADRHCILVFLKEPRPGHVKTRLARILGDETALRLYQHFVRDILNMLGREKHRVILCFHPPHARSEVKKWLGEQYIYWPQEGENLGEKMTRAFFRAFESGYSHVLLMGTDIPDLPAKIIAKAFEELKKQDAVIAPAYDGGYYLIGFCDRRFLPDVFCDIPWSTDSVFEDSMAIFRKHRRKVAVLPPWRDIDEYGDLLAFMERNRESGNSETAAYLKSPYSRIPNAPKDEQ